MTRQLLSLAITLPPGLPADRAVTIAAMAGRLGFSAVHLHDAAEIGELDQLVAAADPALVVIGFPTDATGLVRENDPGAVSAVRAEMDASEVTRPLLVAVPISIGRTMSEAAARADLEPRFAQRHPRDAGIFGTFEQAQEQVLALARAGADGLVLDVPLSRDVADVLAQIRALVVGATPELVNAPAGTGKTPPPRTTFYGE
ncbi:hypothetical protein [Nocardia miyunensis]|uniref:hypothetical protein n=1 Tax=Nocardia miyunensis TaxID=282684 RepID=UPI0008369465|nr:hypothetical protein [Nocardia miyunensis]